MTKALIVAALTFELITARQYYLQTQTQSKNTPIASSVEYSEENAPILYWLTGFSTPALKKGLDEVFTVSELLEHLYSLTYKITTEVPTKDYYDMLPESKYKYFVDKGIINSTTDLDAFVGRSQLYYIFGKYIRNYFDIDIDPTSIAINTKYPVWLRESGTYLERIGISTDLTATASPTIKEVMQLLVYIQQLIYERRYDIK